MQAEMTWKRAFWRAAIWVLPNALPAVGVIGLFYMADVAEPGALEGLVRVLVFLSLGCLIGLPVVACLIHRSGKVALVIAICELATVVALTALLFDFFGGWVPRGFHP